MDDLRAAYGWIVRALIQRPIDARTANALAGLLAGASRLVQDDAPPSLDAVPGLAAFIDSMLDAVTDVAGPEGAAKVRDRLRSKIGDGGGALPRM